MRSSARVNIFAATSALVSSGVLDPCASPGFARTFLLLRRSFDLSFALMLVPSLSLLRVQAIPFLKRNRATVALVVASMATHVPASAEALQRDLGQGLQFFRAHILPADLPSDKAKSGPLVLDLRYTLAETDAAKALDAWLKFRATERTPVLVLFNPDTALSLRDLLASAEGQPGLITLGRPAATFIPDIPIDCSPDEERKAYDALEKVDSADPVLRENIDKPRVDEASIMRARAETSSPAEVESKDLVENADKKPAAVPATPIDRPLQRAVQLHRALLALKRL
jgi:hypothetical protein